MLKVENLILLYGLLGAQKDFSEDPSLPGGAGLKRCPEFERQIDSLF